MRLLRKRTYWGQVRYYHRPPVPVPYCHYVRTVRYYHTGCRRRYPYDRHDRRVPVPVCLNMILILHPSVALCIYLPHTLIPLNMALWNCRIRKVGLDLAQSWILLVMEKEY
jgi:hypothetical protein